jgi:histidinol-phosphate/aromatic aminotransferase/cobyric acid decarboxylase-like protein
MKGKAALLAGLGIGYVLGTRDGRERYEQIKAQATKAWNNPRVQEKADKAQTKAQEAVKQAAGTAQEKVQDKVRGGSEDKTSAPTPAPTSPAPDTVSASSPTHGPA